MNFKKRVNGSWTDTPHYIHNTSTDTLTTFPAVLYPNDTTATVGLKGDMQQTGTQTPTTPIQPSECGEMTGNLIEFKNGTSTVLNVDITINSGIITVNGTANGSGGRLIRISEIVTLEAGTYIISQYGDTMLFYLQNADNTSQYFTGTFIINDTTRFYVSLGFINGNRYDKSFKFMLNTGSTALPYEPYGIKIPILSGGVTTPVYLGEVQSTRRIKKLVLDGTENWQFTTYPYCTFITDYRRTKRITCVCSHLQAISNINIGDSIPVNTCCFLVDNYAFYYKDTSFSSVTDFKTYLAQQYANGTPVCVWYVLATEETAVVNEPLRKIGDYADTVSGITIPTTAGANTLSVDTTLQPSEVTANYRGWHPVSGVHEYDSNYTIATMQALTIAQLQTHTISDLQGGEWS